jgi:hypothetical protein
MRRSHATTVSLLAALTLAACTNAKDVLEPSAIAPQSTQAVPTPGSGTAATPTAPATTAQPSAAAQPSATTQPSAPAQPATELPAKSAAVIARTRLQVAPIVGASVEAATPLTAQLQTRAKQRGITLAGSAGQTPTHVLKGYFSTMSEGKDTTVIYVWDVYDPAGNRLHRINGQQKAASVNGGEGWAAVAPETMQAIADQTIDQFATWLGGQAG